MEENENLLASLGGDNNSEVDYKSKFEALEKTLQSERVEAGRLKKAQEEIARLKSENEKLSARSSEDNILNNLSEEDREDIPEDYQRGAAKIARIAIEQRDAEWNAKFAELKNQINANKSVNNISESDFIEQLNNAYPGFLGSTKPGGDKYEAWLNYQRPNAASIREAMQSKDYETLAYHISNFYNNFLGISAPRSSVNATPDPRNTSGISQSYIGGGKTYSLDEYSRIMEKAQDDFQNQLISVSKYTEIKNELTNAYREGRVR